ncbi:hypothetical protein D3C87_1791190 [compost metagenome]
MPRMLSKRGRGKGVKPSAPAIGALGSNSAIAQTANTLTRSPRPAGCPKGDPRVRMTKTTRVWVSRDSTNHAVWKTGAVAAKTPSRSPKVRRSKTELMGPSTSMKRRTKPMSHRRGLSRAAGSTRSPGMASWETA